MDIIDDLIPPLLSHTQCQVAQKANRTTKTCQRVCLLPTSKTSFFSFPSLKK